MKTVARPQSEIHERSNGEHRAVALPSGLHQSLPTYTPHTLTHTITLTHQLPKSKLIRTLQAYLVLSRKEKQGLIQNGLRKWFLHNSSALLVAARRLVVLSDGKRTVLTLPLCYRIIFIHPSIQQLSNQSTKHQSSFYFKITHRQINPTKHLSFALISK